MVSNVCYEGSEISISLISNACTHNSKANQYAPPPFSLPFAYISRFARVHSYQSSLPRFVSQAPLFAAQWKKPSFIEFSVFSVKMSRYQYFQWKCEVFSDIRCSPRVQAIQSETSLRWREHNTYASTWGNPTRWWMYALMHCKWHSMDTLHC